MTTADDDSRRRVAAHELGHALVGRALGYGIKTVCIISPTMGVTDHNLMSVDRERITRAIDGCTVLYAGQLAEYLVPVQEGYIVPVADTAPLTADGISASLSPRIGADAAAALGQFMTGDTWDHDGDQLDRIAADVAGPEANYFKVWAEVRARRLVREVGPTLVAILPAFLAAGAWTAADLEDAIAALGKEPTHA